MSEEVLEVEVVKKESEMRREELVADIIKIMELVSDYRVLSLHHSAVNYLRYEEAEKE